MVAFMPSRRHERMSRDSRIAGAKAAIVHDERGDFIHAAQVRHEPRSNAEHGKRQRVEPLSARLIAAPAQLDPNAQRVTRASAMPCGHEVRHAPSAAVAVDDVVRAARFLRRFEWPREHGGDVVVLAITLVSISAMQHDPPWLQPRQRTVVRLVSGHALDRERSRHGADRIVRQRRNRGRRFCHGVTPLQLGAAT